MTNQKKQEKYNDAIIANISGWIRENQGSDKILDTDRIKSLMTLKNLSVAEKADKILKYLEKMFPIAGLEIFYSFDDLRKFRIIDEKNEES